MRFIKKHQVTFLLSVLCLTVLSNDLFGQKVSSIPKKTTSKINTDLNKNTAAFQVDNLNYLYQGVVNAISVVSTQRFDSVFVSNANFRTDLKNFSSNNVKISLKPTSTKSVTIFLFYRKKIIAKQVYKIKRLTEMPIASIAGKTGDNIVFAKQQLLSIDALTAKFQDFSYDVNFEVKSFTVYIKNIGQETIAIQVAGNQFNEDLKAKFQIITSGSTVIFDDILVKYLDGSIKKIDPLTVNIK